MGEQSPLKDSLISHGLAPFAPPVFWTPPRWTLVGQSPEPPQESCLRTVHMSARAKPPLIAWHSPSRARFLRGFGGLPDKSPAGGCPKYGGGANGAGPLEIKLSFNGLCSPTPLKNPHIIKPIFCARFANPAQESAFFGFHSRRLRIEIFSRDELFLEQNRAAIVKMGPQNERIPERDWQAERQKWA